MWNSPGHNLADFAVVLIFVCIAWMQDISVDIQEVADAIVSEAHKLGFDPHYVSPFSLHAAANGFNVIGENLLFVVVFTKSDNLSCIVISE